jgi:hypothetical protein
VLVRNVWCYVRCAVLTVALRRTCVATGVVGWG